jgi:hypothetical protein
VDALLEYFDAHLAADSTSPGANVTQVGTAVTRFVLFKVGHIRFAMAAHEIASVARVPEPQCTYVSGVSLVPARYRAQLGAAAGHVHYLHIAGTRLGIGQCHADGTTTVLPAAIVRRSAPASECWIVATLTDPPSLVLDKDALVRHLRARELAG